MSRTSVEKAIDITCSFEGRGYTAIAGNFDGAGLSMGAFQWNTGMHTLQPILREVLEALGHDKAKAIFTNDDLYILKKRLDEGNAKFHQWAKGLSYKDDRGRIRVNDVWYGRFFKMCQTPECQAVQRKYMHPYISNAKRIMGAYEFKSERAFALCLDIAVQNGSVVPRAREQYRARVKPGMNEKARLYILANAVANTAIPRWQADVRSRKMCIVNGEGVVHKKHHKLDLTDEPVNLGEFA